MLFYIFIYTYINIYVYTYIHVFVCRFKLYLKLYILYFIIMGISWSMTTLILSSETSDYQFNVYYVIYLIEPMQYLCFFIIFVWKKNIKRMILKRFGCGLFPEDRYATNAILLSTLTCTTTSGEISMQKKMSSCE